MNPIKKRKQTDHQEKSKDDMDYTFGRGKYAKDKMHANEIGESGSPKWMEPFSKADMFGKPTVFSRDFMKR